MALSILTQAKTQLYLFAHPDDETFFAAAISKELKRGADIHCLWMTCGDYFGGGPKRRLEHARAMSILGLPRDRVSILSLPDLGLIYNLRQCADIIGEAIVRTEPDLIVTTAYEGGHPDHDSLNFSCARAALRGQRSVPVFEFPLYNGAGPRVHWKWRINRFPHVGPDILGYDLDESSVDIKRRMMRAYSSQWMYMWPALLSSGKTRLLKHGEPYRPIPLERDYTLPPHPRPLNYERPFNFFMKIRFDLFREKVIQFMEEEMSSNHS